MALVNCPKCKRENVSDNAESCPSCGYGVKTQLDKERKKRNIITIMTASLIIFLVSFFMIINLVVIPARDYTTALQMLENGDFQEAIVIFEELGDYKDAFAKIKTCQFEIVKQQVDNGENLTEALQYLNEINLSEEDKYIKIDCLWKLAQKKYDESDYFQTILYLDEIGDVDILNENSEVANEILQDSLYNYAVEMYEVGSFDSALEYFQRVEANKEFVTSYIEKAKFMSQIQGKWNCKEMGAGLEISGWQMKLASYGNGGIDIVTDLKTCEINGQEIIDYDSIGQFGNQHYDIFNGKIRYYWTDRDETDNIVKLNYHYWYFEKTDSIPQPKKQPAIGMTAEEVRASTWGNPQDINKTTYTWGTHEQWCYSGYRYIYFENGIVTAISE